MNLFARLFQATLPKPQPRDSEGRFISAHRIAARNKAIELATEAGRLDLAARLKGTI